MEPRLLAHLTPTASERRQVIEIQLLFFQSFFGWVPFSSSFVKSSCSPNPLWFDLFIVLWTNYYSKYFALFNWYPVIKVLFSERYYLAWLYYSITWCDLYNFEIVSQEKTFYLTVKSYETLLKRRIKIEPRFLAHLTATASELFDLSFHSELLIFLWMLRRSPVSWIWNTRLKEL